MAITYQQYLGRFFLPSGSTIDITGEPTVTIPSAYYYVAGYTSESDNQLCEEVQAQIQANTSHTSATVVYSASTGKVTITLGSSAAIVWGTEELRDAMGFSGDSAAATTHTSDIVCRYVWRPSRGIADAPVATGNFWQVSSTTMLGRSRDGTPWSVEGQTLHEATIRYRYIPQSEAIKSTGTNEWGDLESFFEDIAHKGQPIRCYPDRSVNTVNDFVTAVWLPGGESLGEFSDFCKRSVAAFDGLWDASVPFKEWFGTTPIAPTVTGLTWNYFDDTLPVGVAADIEALYAFNGEATQLDDLTANAHDLTGTSTAFNTVVEGFIGLGFNGSIQYSAAVDSGLVITGDITIECICFYQDVSTSKNILYQCGNTSGTDGTAANNTVYRTAFAANNGRLEYFHEYGGGTNLTLTPTTIMPTGTIQLLTLVREDASVKYYQDGILVYSGTASDAPTSGTSGFLTLGGDDTGSDDLLGVIFSMRITPEAFSAAQVLSAYQRVRGLSL